MWIFIKDLKSDINEAAKRAFNDPNRKDSERFETLEEQKADLEKRFALENERYFNLYGVHKEDKANYDFVLDTTNIGREEVAEKIIGKIVKLKDKYIVMCRESYMPDDMKITLEKLIEERIKVLEN